MKDRTDQEIEEPSARGAAGDASIGRAAYDLNVQQYCCGGLNFGYFYDRSPIIAYDGASLPATRWRTSPRPPSPAAELRTFGCTTGDRCMTQWEQDMRFCASIARST